MKAGVPLEQSIKPAIIVNDMMTMLEMIKHGSGIGLVPHFAARHLLESRELVRIMPEIEGVAASFHIIYHKRENLSKKVRVFIDYMIEVTQDEQLFHRQQE